jgi:TonB family protein
MRNKMIMYYGNRLKSINELMDMNNKHLKRFGICTITVIIFVLLSLTGNAEIRLNPENEPSQDNIPEFTMTRQFETVKTIKYTVPAPDVFSKLYDITKYEKVYSSVEKMPQFPGGDNALITFISMNIHYPPIDRDFGVQGKVIVRFIISKTGTIRDVEIVRSLENYFDKEAVRVVKKLPIWIPGEHEGKKVAVYYTIPVTFNLQ